MLKHFFWVFKLFKVFDIFHVYQMLGAVPISGEADFFNISLGKEL